jgi:hypothetical protein
VFNGNERLAAIEANRHNFVGDVRIGDLWYFPAAAPTFPVIATTVDQRAKPGDGDYEWGSRT